MSDVYAALGIEPIINAYAPMTRFGGGIMSAEVADAMRAATQHSIDIPELQARGSRIIAGATGAEAGCVTSGAAAAVLVGTAACIAGREPTKINVLPDTRGMRNEIIVMRSQRNSYDHAVRAAGAVLVEVGLSDRFAGTGVRDAEAWELNEAITDKTAGVFYVAKPYAQPALTDVVKVAHDAGIPVLVDAAAELPPLANLRRFIAEGADLVAFSGGKAINGPQGSGFLCGRRQLVGAALLQQLDLDYAPGEWDLPQEFADGRNSVGTPRHGIARSCKVGKEQIVGALTALKLFAAESDEMRRGRLRATCEALLAALAHVPNLAAEIIPDPDGTAMPVVKLSLDQSGAGVSGAELVRRLRAGSPRIEVNPWRPEKGLLILSPACLRPGDAVLIGRGLSRSLS